MPPPQSSQSSVAQPPPVDYAALAEQARQSMPAPLTTPPPPTAAPAPTLQTDYNALAEQIRKAVPAGPIRPADQPPTTLERVESTYPMVGATIGGVIGNIPGAVLGGATGMAVKKLSRTIMTGAPPKAESFSSGLVGQPPPSAGPVEAGVREGARQALDVGQEAALQYGIGKTAQGVGKVVTGVFKPPPGPATELAKTNKQLGLGLTAPELAGETGVGVAGRLVQDVAERSITGRMIKLTAAKTGRENALRGVATGQEALRRTGSALEETIHTGPTYDMLAHKVEAAKVFAEEVAPKILQLKAGILPPQLQKQLEAAATGGLSPELALRALRASRSALQRGTKEAVPTGSLDALEKILAAKDSVDFGSATALRTGLLETSRGTDTVLGPRGMALTKKFTGDLTEGMSQHYPEWDPLRRLYGRGAAGLKERQVKQLIGTSPPEALAEAQAAAKALPVGQETDAIHNLRYIGDALAKVRRDPGGWTRVYNAFELASILGAGYHSGPAAAAGTAATVELIPGLVAWAAHNPTMTKLLTEGLTSRNPAQAAALIARVYGAYEAQQVAPVKPVASHSQVGQPPPR